MQYTVFFDLDGTLFPENEDRRGGGISDRLLAALNAARDAGHRLFLNTGRTLSTVPFSALRGFRFDGYLCGGCYANVGGKTILSDRMTADELQPLLAHFYGTGTVVLMEGEFNAYAAWTDRSEHFIPVNDPREVFRICELETINKLCILSYLQEDDLTFVREFGDPILRDDIGATEVLPKGRNKAYAIRKTLEYLGISPEHAIAVGDSRNDLDAFSAVGLPVAMGNASDEVKAHAKYVIPSVEEDGAAVLLEQLCSRSEPQR